MATITLNRPRRNAVGDGMREELADAYRFCDREDGVRVVVLTGTPPAFCAGADLADGERTFADPGPGCSAAGVDVAAWTLGKPVIAAEILLTGATFDGHRAVQLGLGSRVLAADQRRRNLSGAAGLPALRFGVGIERRTQVLGAWREGTR